MKKIILTCLVGLILQGQAHAITLDLKGFDQISDKHFRVYFKREVGEESARQILNKAEEYYSTIADHLGYARYQNFWTWDQRVPIVYFSSQEEFARTTERPAWSKGFSVSHLASVNYRMIVTFHGQEDFLTTTLPHEISHLILHDFVGGNRRIPLWFDEGIAQFEEQRHEENYKIMAQLVANGQSLPLVLLHSIGTGEPFDSRYASIFYAESLYIVDFLVKTYGKESFINLCRYLRDGKDFEEALHSAYYPAVDSIADLQDKWITYMRQYL